MIYNFKQKRMLEWLEKSSLLPITIGFIKFLNKFTLRSFQNVLTYFVDSIKTFYFSSVIVKSIYLYLPVLCK